MKEIDYLYRKYKIDDNELKMIKERCDRINFIMTQLKVGDKLYMSNCWGDVFEQEVIEIINKDKGDIRIFEKSINKTKDINVDDLMTYEDVKKLYI